MHCEGDTRYIPGLPDDLAHQVLVRVPRLHHGVMRCVCRKWSVFLCSEQYLSLRKSLGLAEAWIYALIRDKAEFLHWHVMDPRERKWLKLPHMPQRLGGYRLACEVVGKELFVMGGWDKYEGCTDKVVRYDALTNTWASSPSMQVERCHFVSASLNGRLYAIGGLGFKASWEIFDIDSGIWSLYENSGILWDLCESLVYDGKIYVRYASPGLEFPPYAEVYEPELNTWTTLNNQMTQMWLGPAVTVADKAYMLDQSFGIKLTVLDRETEEWCTVGRISPHSIGAPCRIAAVGKTLYIVGRGLKTIVINLENAGTTKGVLLTSSIQGLPSAEDDMVVSCNVIEL